MTFISFYNGTEIFHCVLCQLVGKNKIIVSQMLNKGFKRTEL